MPRKERCRNALAGDQAITPLTALVHEIRVEGRDRVVPWFRVPGGANPKVRALARSAPPGLHNANLSTELPGDVLSLVGAHAKVRRGGYRR